MEGKPAVGIRVSHKGHRDVSTSSSTRTVDCSWQARERTVKDDATDKEVSEEHIYSGYKEIGLVREARDEDGYQPARAKSTSMG